MRHLESMQREVVIESARAIDEIVTAIKKRHGRLVGYGVLPRFIHVLLDRVEAALIDVTSGIVAWADGLVDDDGAKREAVALKEHAVEHVPDENSN